MITDGGLFTHIAHDLTSLENFNQLVREGYLCPLISKRTQIELDISNVGIQGGEFIQSQLQSEVDKAEITWKGLQELCYYGQGRRSWLIFATGIEHANHISEMLNRLEIDCASVHSKQSVEYNDNAIRAFRNYELRAIVNFGKLTTGFDHPGIDLIGMFRPTLSVALWVQMLGRGTRPFEGKSNCLVLDYARNTVRLGPINDPVLPRKKGDKGGDIPIKICEACGVYNHIKAVKCDVCGSPFSFKIKIVERAGTEQLLKETVAPIIETFDVNYVTYSQKQKANKAPYIKAVYFSGMQAFTEFVFPEGRGLGRKQFADWWRMRHKSELPTSTTEAMSHIAELRAPRRIRVHTNRMLNGRNYPEVLSCEF
jgi:DNA repair protein RadD